MVLPKDVFVDDLTGIYNRRYLMHWVDGEIKKCRRYRLPFSFVLLDIDNFKEINDSKGHIKGDLVLKLFSQFLKLSLRDADVITRYGGDEFILLLPNTPKEQAEIVAKRILVSLKKQEFSGNKLSATGGIATFPDDGNDWETLFKIADQRMYAAKRLGKGRIGTIDTISKELNIPSKSLVDRKDELSMLKDLMTKKTNKLIIIQGEAGVGKTRLAEEAVSQVVGLNLFTGHSYATMRASPYYAIRDLNNSILQDFEDDARDVFVNSLNIQEKREISRLIPPLSSGFEPLVGDKIMLFDSFRKFLISLSKKINFAILFDDLHWGNESTLELIYYLIKRGNSHFPIIGTYRVEELENTPVQKTLRILGRENLYQEIFIQPLTKINVKELVQIILQEEIPENVLDYIYKETGGNPFFIEEILKSMKEKEILYVRDGKWALKEDFDTWTIPKSVEDTVLYKFSLLDKTIKNVVEIAAVIGRDFDFEILALISGLNQGELYDILYKLISIGLFKETSPQNYFFTEDVFREVIYKNIPKGQKMSLHLKIGKIIEERTTEFPDKNEFLSTHFYHAGEQSKVTNYAIISGDKAESVYAHKEALKFYQWALQGKIDKKTKISLLIKLGKVSGLIGEYKSAISYIEEAISLSSGEGRGNSFFELGKLYSGKGDFENALSSFRKARRAFKDKQKKYVIDVQIAWVYNQLGKLDSAYRKIKKVMAHLNKKSHEEDYATALNIFATLNMSEKNYEVAEKYFQESLELRKKLGDKIGIASIYLNSSNIDQERNEYGKAEEKLLKALELYRDTGFKEGEATALNNLGSLYLAINDLKKAESYYRQALDISEWTGGISTRLLLLSNLSVILRYKGALEDAKKLLEDALSLAKVNKLIDWEFRLYVQLSVHFLKFAKDPTRGKENLNKASELLPHIESQRITAYYYLSEARYLIQTNNIERAIFILKEKLSPILKNMKNDFTFVLYNILLGLSYSKKEWKKWGLRYLKIANDVAVKNVKDESFVAEVYEAYGDFYKNLGEYTKAKNYYNKSLSLNKKLELHWPIENLEAKIKELKSKK